jgi:hypothetical protein
MLELDFVVYGPEERALGEPAWLEGWSPAFQVGEVALFEVPAR